MNSFQKSNFSISFQRIGVEQNFNRQQQHSALSNVEEGIYNSIKLEKRRNEWLAGRLAAKKAFLKFCKEHHLEKIDNVTILNSEGGSPYILEFPDLYLSITHSNEFAIAVVSPTLIGIDLEKIEHGEPSLIKYFFSDKECKDILEDSKSSDQLSESIIKYWTRKEAVAKYLKLGMKINFKLLDTTNDYLSITNKSNQLIKLVSYKMRDYYLSVAY